METAPRQDVQTQVGQGWKRVEDQRLLTGKGRFIDDLEPVANIAHAAILRSIEAHARITSMDASEAEEAPGVFGVLTGEDIREMSEPFPLAVDVPVNYYPMAIDKVHYVGEPVAVVVAKNRYIAEDAADLIRVEYEPLPVVMDPEAALEPDAPLLHEDVGSNVGNHRTFEFGDPETAFEEADVVIEDKFKLHRYSSTPIETYGVIADYNEAEDSMTIWSNFHGPFILHRVVSSALGIPQNQLTFIIPPDIGGSFGIKSAVYPYMTLMGLASRKLGRPVKWIEDRAEHMAASSSGTARVAEVRAAFRQSGDLIGLDYRFIDDVGGYIRSPEPASMYRCFGNFTGAYTVRNVWVETISVMTNKTPTGLNRGFGGPQLYFPLERIMDLAAEELELDPADLRSRNLVGADQFPYRTPLGSLYDSGDYEAVLNRALELCKYGELREKQERAREEGRYLGIGIATIVDPSGTNMGYVTLAQPPEERKHGLSGCTDAATINMDPSGRVTVRLTSTPQGQGHETVATQIVVDELGLPADHVRAIAEMDTSALPWTITTGSYSSRFAPLSASAIAMAARKLRAKLARIAAHTLDVDVDDLEFEDGTFKVRDDPETSLPLRAAAGIAHWNSSSLPEDIDPGLYETGVYSLQVTAAPDDEDQVDSSACYGFLADIAVVEVDPETYDVQIVDYISVHDAGRILNPMIVDGQIYGATAHGIGGTFFEEFVYDEDGQLLTSSFNNYLCPSATEMPTLTLDHIETPSPFSLLGAKGLGEGNSMSAPAALANAVSDAMGLSITQLPITQSTIYEAIHEEKGDTG